MEQSEQSAKQELLESILLQQDDYINKLKEYSDGLEAKTLEQDELISTLGSKVSFLTNANLEQSVEITRLEKELERLTSCECEKCKHKDQEINDLNITIERLDGVVYTGEELIKGLESKVIELTQMNQTLKKEMQELIAKTQMALVQVDKKNQIIGSGIVSGVFLLLSMIVYWIFN